MFGNRDKATAEFEVVTKGIQDLKSITNSWTELNQAMEVAKKVLGFIEAAGEKAIRVMGIFVSKGQEFERYRTQFMALLGDMDAAQRRIDEIAKMASWTPFQPEELIQAGKQLTAFRIYTEENLRIIGDASATFGKELLDTVQAVAMASAGQIRSLVSYGITSADIQKELGHEIVRDTKAGLQEMTEAVFKILDRTTGGGMAMLSKTFDGILSNLEQRWGDFTQLVAEQGGVFESVKALYSNLFDMVNELFKTGAAESAAKVVGHTLVTMLSVTVEAAATVGLRIVDLIERVDVYIEKAGGIEAAIRQAWGVVSGYAGAVGTGAVVGGLAAGAMGLPPQLGMMLGGGGAYGWHKLGRTPYDVGQRQRVQEQGGTWVGGFGIASPTAYGPGAVDPATLAWMQANTGTGVMPTEAVTPGGAASRGTVYDLLRKGLTGTLDVIRKAREGGFRTEHKAGAAKPEAGDEQAFMWGISGDTIRESMIEQSTKIELPEDVKWKRIVGYTEEENERLYQGWLEGYASFIKAREDIDHEHQVRQKLTVQFTTTLWENAYMRLTQAARAWKNASDINLRGFVAASKAAFAETLSAFIDAKMREAAIEQIMAAAKALTSAGGFNFWSAAKHAAAAVMFGSVGSIASGMLQGYADKQMSIAMPGAETLPDTGQAATGQTRSTVGRTTGVYAQNVTNNIFIIHQGSVWYGEGGLSQLIQTQVVPAIDEAFEMGQIGRAG